jgi:hypothetical protein
MMADRVPICTVPGLVTPLLDQDVMIAPADAAKTITRVFLQRTDQPAGGGTITASVRNATAGGGEGIAVSITGTDSQATASGSITVEATEPIYLRVTADDAESQNLRGWFQVDDVTPSLLTAALTNSVRVKQFLGEIAGSTDDAMINNLIAAVSDEIQTALMRRFVSTTATEEKHSSRGLSTLTLSHYPVLSITTLTESDSALVEDTDFEATERDLLYGQLTRISGTTPIGWTSGDRNISVTYDHGYSAVPEAIVQAATELVAYDYRQAKGWFGMTRRVLDTGGDAEYRSRQQVWAAQKSRFAGYTRLAV